MQRLKDKQDMQAHLEKTCELVRRGEYQEALDRFLWFHEHALEHEPAMYGVRLSFALAYWKSLGDIYAPAMTALVETRDRKMKEVRAGAGDADLFHDVKSLNRNLGEDKKTLDLFLVLDADYPALAKECWPVVEDVIVAAKRYDLAKKYIGRADRAFERIRSRYDKATQYYNDPKIGGERFQAYTEESFVKDCLALIEVALASGKLRTATSIQEKAVSVLDDPRLRGAVPPNNE